MELLTSSKPSWYLESRGYNLHIDDYAYIDGKCVIDVETDEQDKFVGVAVYPGAYDVYYYTNFKLFSNVIVNIVPIGHNFKFDLHQLRQWGIKVPFPIDDTIIMSYVLNPVRSSHGLKELEKELLGIERPTYKDIVGTRKKKQTLDKQPVELVANYCASDCIATWKLYELFKHQITVSPSIQKCYLKEMQIMRILYQMECKGVQVDVEYLRELDNRFNIESRKIYEKLRSFVVLDSPSLSREGRSVADRVRKDYDSQPTFRSPEQVSELLFKPNNIHVKSTNRQTLQDHENIPLVRTLLRYREIEKLRTTYTQGLLSLKSLPRVHSTFNQVSYRESKDTWSGIRTGRLSSNNPNLHNIPIRTQTGDLLRRAFIPKPGCILIDADYSQIEYRLLAHFSEEPRLLEAFYKGADIHEETGKILGIDRRLGKTLNFASIYGAHSWKIAKTAKISQDDAQRFLEKYWKLLPKVSEFVNFTKAQAACDKGIKTLCGWFIPLPDIDDADPKIQARAERQAVNYRIQGSAAEIIKLAMIDCVKEAYDPILQVHDELLFEVDEKFPGKLIMPDIKQVMQDVIKLKVPLDVDIKWGYTWSESH